MEPQTTPSSSDQLKLSTQTSLLRKAKRWIKIVIGGTVLLLGISLIVLPGPAIIVIPLGLAILATELVWARRLLNKVKEKLPFQNKEDKNNENNKST